MYSTGPLVYLKTSVSTAWYKSLYTELYQAIASRRSGTHLSFLLAANKSFHRICSVILGRNISSCHMLVIWLVNGEATKMWMAFDEHTAKPLWGLPCLEPQFTVAAKNLMQNWFKPTPTPVSASTLYLLVGWCHQLFHTCLSFVICWLFFSGACYCVSIHGFISTEWCLASVFIK